MSHLPSATARPLPALRNDEVISLEEYLDGAKASLNGRTVNCFISRAWEEDEENPNHLFVKRLAKHLSTAGVNVQVDERKLKVGAKIPNFIKQIQDSNFFVIALFTPLYKKKEKIPGSWIAREVEMIYNRLRFTDNFYIPLLLQGKEEESIPDKLQQYECLYLDFRDGAKYATNVSRIFKDKLLIPELLGTSLCAKFIGPSNGIWNCLSMPCFKASIMVLFNSLRELNDPDNFYFFETACDDVLQKELIVNDIADCYFCFYETIVDSILLYFKSSKLANATELSLTINRGFAMFGIRKSYSAEELQNITSSYEYLINDAFVQISRAVLSKTRNPQVLTILNYKFLNLLKRKNILIPSWSDEQQIKLVSNNLLVNTVKGKDPVMKEGASFQEQTLDSLRKVKEQSYATRYTPAVFIGPSSEFSSCEFRFMKCSPIVAFFDIEQLSQISNSSNYFLCEQITDEHTLSLELLINDAANLFFAVYEEIFPKINTLSSSDVLQDQQIQSFLEILRAEGIEATLFLGQDLSIPDLLNVFFTKLCEYVLLSTANPKIITVMNYKYFHLLKKHNIIIDRFGTSESLKKELKASNMLVRFIMNEGKINSSKRDLITEFLQEFEDSSFLESYFETKVDDLKREELFIQQETDHGQSKDERDNKDGDAEEEDEEELSYVIGKNPKRSFVKEVFAAVSDEKSSSPIHEDEKPFEDLKFPPLLRVSIICLKILMAEEELKEAMKSKTFSKAIEINKEKKRLKSWLKKSSQGIVKALPAELVSEDFMIVKSYTIKQLGDHFEQCIEHDNEQLLAGIDAFKTKVESLNLISSSPLPMGIKSSSQLSNQNNEVSRLGIRLSFLKVFLERILMEGANATITTAEVLERFIFPVTEPMKCSYCEYLLQTEPTTSAVGLATVFISHAWQYKFVEVIGALIDYFGSERERGGAGAGEGFDVVVWFDIFSNNQHSTQLRSFDWWCNTFKTAVKDIGNTVMVLAPWSNPAPLQRGWCIWELYCTIDTNSMFAVAMNKKSEDEFVKDIDQSYTRAVDKMLATIDCENSKCTVEIDNIQIHDAIKASVGFTTLNKKIFEAMRSWIIDRYGKELNKRKSMNGENDESTLRCMNNLAFLYQTQGKYDLAEPLYLEYLDKQKSALGATHPDTLMSMNNLAGLYQRQGKYDLAEQLYLERLEKTKSAFGANHPDTLMSMNNLAGLYQRQGKYDLAEQLYLERLEKTKSAFGANHPDTLMSMNNLAGLYESPGKYDLAEQLYLERLEKTKSALGAYRPDTLMSMNNLAGLYESPGKYDLAEQLYLERLEMTKSALGANHPDTLMSMNNLAGLYEIRGKYDLAEQLYLEYLEKTKSASGANRPDTLMSMNNLAGLYQRQGKYDLAEQLYLERLEKTKSAFGANHPDTLMSMNNLAGLYQRQGKYDLAEQLYLERLEKTKSAFGANHPDTLMSMNNLAGLYQRQGKYDLAEQLYLERLEKTKSALGANHPDTLMSMNNLAGLYEIRGKYDLAEQLYLEYLEKTKSASGANRPDTLMSMNNLAGLYQRQGKYDLAEQLYLERLEKTKSAFGANHPDTLMSMNNLAGLYQRQGKYDLAEQLYLERLEKTKSAFGANHPDTLMSMNNLAGLYEIRGKYDLAEQLYLERLEKTKSALGANHPDTLMSMNNLAGLYQRQGKYDLAEQLYLERLEKTKSAFGANHPDTLMSMNNLAGLYESPGKYDLAEQLYLERLEKTKSASGANRPDTLMSMNNLAGLYESPGKYDLAEQLYLERLEKTKSALGATHPDTLMSMNNLAGLYESPGKYDLAEQLYLERLEMTKSALGATHPDTLLNMNNLAGLYQRQGKYDLAEPLYLECLEKTKSALGATHPDTLLNMNNLAGLYQRQGKYDLAEPLYLEYLEKTKSALGATHPDTLLNMNNLAGLYQRQGKYDLAEPLYLECLEKTKSALGATHPDTLLNMNNLAGLFVSQGKYDLAEQLYLECFEKRKSAFGATHPDTLMSMNNLAGLFVSQGKYDLAEPLYLEYLDKQKSALGASHPDTLMTMNNLAGLYQRQRKYDLAEPLYLECLNKRSSTLGANHPDTTSQLQDCRDFNIAMKFKDSGNKYFIEANYKQALSDYEKAMHILEGKKSRQGLFVTCSVNSAEACIRLCNYSDAIKYATVAIKLDENNLKALFRRAVARNRLGLNEEALEDLNQAIRLDPDNKAVKAEIVTAKKGIKEANAKAKKIYGNMFSK